MAGLYFHREKYAQKYILLCQQKKKTNKFDFSYTNFNFLKIICFFKKKEKKNFIYSFYGKDFFFKTRNMSLFISIQRKNRYFTDIELKVHVYLQNSGFFVVVWGIVH